MKNKKKIDERLLGLPHSSLSHISKSLEKIEVFSSDLAEKDGIVGLLGRAVLLRAKQIRQTLNTEKKATAQTQIKTQTKASTKNQTKPQSKARTPVKKRTQKRSPVQVGVRAKKSKAK